MVATPQALAAQVLSGSYTGDASNGRVITELGFQPDVVILKGDAAQIGVIRTSTMTGDNAKPMTGATALTANLIESITSTGFTVGNDARVNANLTEYYWIGFKQGAKRLKVGSYTGNGAASRALTGVGFSPEFVIVMSAGAAEVVWRSSADTEGFNFANSAGNTAWITSLDADGFTVGNDTRVNTNGTVYHYVAWNEVDGVMDVGAYTGDGAANRNIATTTFQSEYVLVKRDGANNAVHHTASLGQAVDDSLYFTATVNAAGRIEELNSGGFQVGTNTDVNGSGSVYNYVAWRRVVAQTEVLSGSYVGNGADNRQITGLGFSPDLVIVKGDTAQNAVLRAYPWAGDFTKDLIDGTVTADRIQSLDTEGFTIGTDARVNSNGVTYHWIAWIGGAGEMTAGTYTGNGASGRNITDLGFAPDFVIVLGSTVEAVYRNSAAAASHSFDAASSAAWISALGADGFTIGNDARVNSNGGTYAYIAWREVAGRMDVGTYAGDGADDRSIAGVGFQPEYAFVQRNATGYNALHHPRSIGASTDSTLFFDARGAFANYIQGLEADGFQVGNQTNVNAASATYVYAAWAASTLTAVRMAGTSARRTDNGVTISWRTGYEVDNLGFNVYREAGGERTRITEKPVAGSGLTVAPGFAVTAAQSYRWTDESPEARAKGVTYWVEDIDLNGTRTMHGPIEVVDPEGDRDPARRTSVPRDGAPPDSSDGSAPSAPNSPLLTDLARAGEPQDAPVTAPPADSGTSTEATQTAAGGVVYQVPIYPRATVQAPSRGDTSDPVRSRTEEGPARTVEDRTASATRRTAAPASTTQVAVQGSSEIRLASDPAPSGSGSSSGGSGSSSAPPPPPATVPQALRIQVAPRPPAPPPVPSGAPRAPESAEMLQQWDIASRPGARIAVRTAGWYRVTQAALVAAGIDAGANPRNLRLLVDGVELPLVVNGETDDSFDPGDSVEFYATALDTPHTDARTYWITSGPAAGLRLPQVDATAPGTPAGDTFTDTVEQKPRHVFFGGLLNGDQENFFGPAILEGGLTTQTITLPHVAASGVEADVEVGLQGVTALPAANDHRVAVFVNGTEVGEMVFDGRAAAAVRFTVAHSLVSTGANTIAFEARGGPDDITLVDYVRVSYQREHRAEANQVTLGAAGGQQLTLRGFTNDAIRVYDVTGGAAARQLTGTVAPDAGGWAVTFTAPAGDALRLFATTADAAATPAAVASQGASTLHAAAQSGDVVLITAAGFTSALTPLRDLRQSQGHTVKIVDVQDIYDEFSFGHKDPAAIRAFLVRAAEQWTKPPRYVALVGNATTDPRDYQGLGEPDVVPTRMVATGVLETASDDWFADADGDGFAELAAVGRLPARNAAQVTTMVDKIVAYEQSSPEAWHNNVLLVSDRGDEDVDEFAGYNDIAGQLVPAGYQVTHLKRAEDPTPAQTLKARLADGAVLVNYQGHGSVEVWRGDILTAADVPALGNGSRLPFVVAMTCLSGFFQGLHPEESLAEVLLRTAGGGAIGVWASSGLTDARWQSSMDRELFRQIFRGPWKTVGDAIRAAKKVVGDPDVRRTWIYFGDPALRLKGLANAPVESTPAVTTRPSPPTPAGGDPSDPAGAHRRAPGTAVRLADLDADGLGDALISQPDTGIWYAAIGSPGSFRYAPGQFTVAGEPLALNLDGDARSDVFVYDRRTGQWLQGISQGNGTFLTTTGDWPRDLDVLAGDFDGNGRDEIFAHHESGLWFQAFPVTGGFAFKSGYELQRGEAHAADFNGDGRADVFVLEPSTGRWTILFSTSGAPVAGSGMWTPGWQAVVANLNGDNSADVVLWHAASGAWVQCIRDAAQVWVYRSGTWSPGGRMLTANLTGDSRDEMFRYDWRTGDWTMATTSLGGVVTQWDGLWEAGWELTPGRLDSDARDDLLLYNPDTGEWARRLNLVGGWSDDASGLWSTGWIVAGRLR